VSPSTILDTSVLVAVEQGRPLARELPDDWSVAVVTLAELELGVLRATDIPARSRRLQTLDAVRREVTGVPADARVASAYARLAASQLERGRRPRVQDTWIAATALVHRAEVWTQDADFDSFDGDVTVVRI